MKQLLEIREMCGYVRKHEKTHVSEIYCEQYEGNAEVEHEDNNGKCFYCSIEHYCTGKAPCVTDYYYTTDPHID